ncbi:MAG: hypothetical protein JXA08_00445 [Methanomicrobiaceae archaeon]|nr:hypothetical protein [Methanomicrobiaceae archaeon]
MIPTERWAGFTPLPASVRRPIRPGPPSLKRDVLPKKTMPPGGGDILLHPVKPGGTPEMKPDDNILEVTCGGRFFSVALGQFSYLPANNFRVDQGMHGGSAA